ncbi:MAG: hypothetical protein E7507_01205 [Ruminococcus sp.]|nr:hypothetical protein [Ruminococcus sp.]
MPSDFDDVSDYDNDGLINAEEIDWGSSLIKDKSLWTYDNLSTIDDCISHFSDKGELSYVQNGLTRLQALPGSVYSELMTIRILPINSDPLSVDGDRDGHNDYDEMYTYCTELLRVNYTDYYYVYSRKGHDFIEQAEWMKVYADDGDIIQTIYVQKYDKVVSNWNNMTSYVDDIHLFCHGGVCQLYFFGEDVDLTDISELNTYNITGKLYLYSCHGGTYSNEYDNTMAWELSKRINGKKVIAVNGDSVDYFRMWLPFSKKPVLHDGIGYWAEYYWIYCNDKYIRYSNPLGREWRT